MGECTLIDESGRALDQKLSLEIHRGALRIDFAAKHRDYNTDYNEAFELLFSKIRKIELELIHMSPAVEHHEWDLDFDWPSDFDDMGPSGFAAKIRSQMSSGEAGQQGRLQIDIELPTSGTSIKQAESLLDFESTREDYNILRSLLKERNFDFISPGTHHIHTVYGFVREEYPKLCDDKLVMERNMPMRRSEHPLWKNRTQFALSDCTEFDYVSKGDTDYWIFGEGAAINPPTELVDDEELESSDSYENESPSLPPPPVPPLPPPSFRHAQPRGGLPANGAPNSPSGRTSGDRIPKVGFVYVRALYSVDDQESFRLGSSFKHGSFRDGREEGRRSTGYTDLPPFEGDGLWLESEFVAVAGPFKDHLLAERQFSNRLVPLWNIQIGRGNQKEWHPYHGGTHEERRDELVQIASELSSFAQESEVKFEYRPIFDSLCT